MAIVISSVKKHWSIPRTLYVNAYKYIVSGTDEDKKLVKKELETIFSKCLMVCDDSIAVGPYCVPFKLFESIQEPVEYFADEMNKAFPPSDLKKTDYVVVSPVDSRWVVSKAFYDEVHKDIFDTFTYCIPIFKEYKKMFEFRTVDNDIVRSNDLKYCLPCKFTSEMGNTPQVMKQMFLEIFPIEQKKEQEQEQKQKQEQKQDVICGTDGITKVSLEFIETARNFCDPSIFKTRRLLDIALLRMFPDYPNSCKCQNIGSASYFVSPDEKYYISSTFNLDMVNFAVDFVRFVKSFKRQFPTYMTSTIFDFTDDDEIVYSKDKQYCVTKEFLDYSLYSMDYAVDCEPFFRAEMNMAFESAGVLKSKSPIKYRGYDVTFVYKDSFIRDFDTKTEEYEPSQLMKCKASQDGICYVSLRFIELCRAHLDRIKIGCNPEHKQIHQFIYNPIEIIKEYHRMGFKMTIDKRKYGLQVNDGEMFSIDTNLRNLLHSKDHENLTNFLKRFQ